MKERVRKMIKTQTSYWMKDSLNFQSNGMLSSSTKRQEHFSKKSIQQFCVFQNIDMVIRIGLI